MRGGPNTSTSHNEDDDTNSLDGIDSSWEDVVMKAYDRARMMFEKMIETEGKVTNHNRCCSCILFKRPYQNAVARKRRYRVDPQDDSAIAADLNLKKCLDSKKKVQSILLEEIRPLPPMIYWTLTEMNIKAEDQLTLSHVPYVSRFNNNFSNKQVI